MVLTPAFVVAPLDPATAENNPEFFISPLVPEGSTLKPVFSTELPEKFEFSSAAVVKAHCGENDPTRVMSELLGTRTAATFMVYSDFASRPLTRHWSSGPS